MGVIFSPTFDPSEEGLGPGIGARLARFNAEVAAAINVLHDDLDRVIGRVVGVDTAQHTLAWGGGCPFSLGGW